MAIMARDKRIGQLFFKAFSSYLILAVLSLATGDCVCDFPSEFQTSVTGRTGSRDWQSRVKEQFTEFHVKIEVVQNVLRTISADSSVKSSNRTCQQVVEGNKYLVKHEEDGLRGQKYSCLQLVFRSPYVFQMRTSTPVESMEPSAVCSNDAMQLDKWLVVDKARIATDGREVCPLQGGFNIIVFDKLRGQGVCDAWRGEIRMESECSRGDGLTFFFRVQRCVPEGMYMYSTQRTICLATWNEGHYTFTLIRHDFFNYTWLLRFPTSRPNTFTTILFKDLFADATDFITETQRYLRFDTIVDSPYDDLSALCRDEYEVCTTLRGRCSATASDVITACPMACGICNRTTASLCNLNQNWVGSWSDSADTNRTVDVNSTTFTVHRSQNGDVSYRCLRWNSASVAPVSPRPAADDLFVTVYSNGCRPQYKCTKLLKQSSSLLYIGLSKSMTWPLEESNDDWVSKCSAATVTTDDHLFLHAPGRPVEPVLCQLPSEAMRTFKVRLQNGTECLGNLNETNNGTGFGIVFNDCQSDSLQEKSFVCLESSTVPDSKSSDRFVITKSIRRESNDLYCWLFPRNQLSVFYLTDGTRCHLVLKSSTQLTSSQYLLHGMSFRLTRKPTTVTGLGKRPIMVTLSGNSSEMTTKTSVEISVRPVNEEKDTTISNYAVVAIVVIALAILQTIFLCKCS